MTRLACIFLAAFIASAITAILLSVALVNEAARSSAYAQQSYKNGLRDGEIYVRGEMVRAQIEREIIEEQKERMATKKL
jgi:hypothetical protein